MMKRDAFVAGLMPRPGTINLTCACLPPLPGLIEASVARAGEALGEAARDHGYSALGLPALRRAIARHLEGRGLPTPESHIMVTSGAQQAIALAGALLLRRSDSALVESPTFLGALEALGAPGATLSPVRPARRRAARCAARSAARSTPRASFT